MKQVFLLLCCLMISACAVPEINKPVAVEVANEPEEEIISTQGISSADGALWIQIEEPLDGEVIPSQIVKVKGQASPETVLTINEEIIYVQDGPFEVIIPLDMGDNLLEITASDINGNEITLYLLVTRE